MAQATRYKRNALPPYDYAPVIELLRNGGSTEKARQLAAHIEELTLSSYLDAERICDELEKERGILGYAKKKKKKV